MRCGCCVGDVSEVWVGRGECSLPLPSWRGARGAWAGGRGQERRWEGGSEKEGGKELSGPCDQKRGGKGGTDVEKIQEEDEAREEKTAMDRSDVLKQKRHFFSCIYMSKATLAFLEEGGETMYSLYVDFVHFRE